MSPLGRRIVVFAMIWVLCAMVAIQVYDNVTGRNMPVKKASPTAVAESTPDSEVAQLADLQGCVAADPNNLKCVTDLAALYYARQQYPQAQVNYQRAVALDPHNVALLLRLAGTHIYQNRFSDAATTLQQAEALQPDSPEIHLLLGLALSKSQPPRKSDAIAEWRLVISLAPETTYSRQAAAYINEATK